MERSPWRPFFCRCRCCCHRMNHRRHGCRRKNHRGCCENVAMMNTMMMSTAIHHRSWKQRSHRQRISHSQRWRYSIRRRFCCCCHRHGGDYSLWGRIRPFFQHFTLRRYAIRGQNICTAVFHFLCLCGHVAKCRRIQENQEESRGKFREGGKGKKRKNNKQVSFCSPRTYVELWYKIHVGSRHEKMDALPIFLTHPP